jgi:hypothetical protein
MSLEKILSISGKPGLFKLISHAKGHIIVESLADGKRLPVAGANHINTLDNIAIYTYTEELPLADVLYKIHQKEGGKETISHKVSSNELMTFFESVLPDYDVDRVYASHVKKIVQWYNLLINSKFDFDALKTETDTTDAPQ